MHFHLTHRASLLAHPAAHQREHGGQVALEQVIRLAVRGARPHEPVRRVHAAAGSER